MMLMIPAVPVGAYWAEGLVITSNAVDQTAGAGGPAFLSGGLPSIRIVTLESPPGDRPVRRDGHGRQVFMTSGSDAGLGLGIGLDVVDPPVDAVDPRPPAVTVTSETEVGEDSRPAPGGRLVSSAGVDWAQGLAREGHADDHNPSYRGRHDSSIPTAKECLDAGRNQGRNRPHYFRSEGFQTVVHQHQFRVTGGN